MDAIGTNLGMLAIAVAALVCAAALVAWARRRDAAAEGASPSALTRGERVVVAIVGGGALVAIPLSVYSLLASAVWFASAPVLRVDDLPLGGSTAPGFLESATAVTGAGYDTAWIEVADLPAGPRWLLWAEAALPMALALVLAVGIASLAFALLRGAPFARTLPVALGGAAIVVVAAGLGTQVFGAIARAEIISSLGPPQLITSHDDGSGVAEGFIFALSLDLSPIGWGLGIALLSAVFAIGTRMQHDTKGLV
ncbi:hypothetical protein E4V99_05145 [Microbacterium sp. dk485]|uniref:hypothetical protein n=1 Tax=Microbacterium sp. dk485 TaxID=2560021 RepID=UPI001073FAE0|nr:hypothetical protein [Microbacterium sp. dk485]TFV84448.1 hypothetical protein E4V99_05145 [Microbacterium sp. dk485]